MGRYGSSAEFSTIVEGEDLYEISEGILRFKSGKSGRIVAKFMVTDVQSWKKIRFAYRKCNEGDGWENYILARLCEIDKFHIPLECRTVCGIRSQRWNDDESHSTTSIKATDPAITNHNSYFYYMEITMVRSSVLVVPPQPDLVRSVNSIIQFLEPPTTVDQDQPELKEDEQNENQIIEETPSVPIPPPSSSEINLMESHIKSNPWLGPAFGVLTPSPEFIFVGISTASTGF